jgi:glycerol-3-phosphate acyltransferase PlsY
MLKGVVALSAFFIGAIPFSYLVSRRFGHMDIRRYGSGNVGATNVGRHLGVRVGALAFFFDFAKGFGAAWLGYAAGSMAFASFCGILAVLGHCYSPWLKFSGGKGVATSTGVLAFIAPGWLPALAAVFVTVAFLTRYVSLASISAAAALPVLALVTRRPEPILVSSVFLSVFVIWRHKKNLLNLRAGREAKLRKRFLLF